MRFRPSLIDLPDFAEQLGALDHGVAETRGAGARPDDLHLDDVRESECEREHQSEDEGPSLGPFVPEPIPTDSIASGFEARWAAPVAFFLLMLVGATAAALVFHRQVALILY